MPGSSHQSPANNGLSSFQDDIAAIASPPGQGAIGIIRLSGERLRHKLARTLKLSHHSLNPPAAKLTRCQVLDQTGDVLDDGMVVFFDAPRSYTGEDTCEIYTHGGPFIIGSVLRALLAIGFRQAEAGEFTRRAFLNGKMDLTQAEGIAALTEAHSEAQWQAGRSLVGQALSRHIQELRAEIINAMAFLEARIDFPDEGDTSDVEISQVDEIILKTKAKLKKLSDTYDSGKVARNGLKVALVGAPNAGKSTLLNTLIGQERAIVTAIEGTTRDYIEESCLLKGRLIRLVDTAGLRHTTQAIEAEGIKRSRDIASQADVVLLLGTDEAMLDTSWLKKAASRVIKVFTKCDLGQPTSATWDCHISCHSGEGLGDLRDRIVTIADQLVTQAIEAPAFITNSRHQDACLKALDSIETYQTLSQQGSYDECLAFELREAAQHLRSIIGTIDQEDVLDVIFSTFCVGK